VDSDIDLLKSFVNKAGAIALEKQKQHLDIQFKPDSQGPVTNVDLEIDTLAKNFLQTARPDYGWLSEETADTDHRLKAKRTFILDPIDGTNAYIAGRKDFTIAIAIVENGIPVIATIFAPAHGDLYWAIAGQGAWCNDDRLQTSENQMINAAKVLGRKKDIRNQLGEEHYNSIEWGFRSSLAYRYCLVAQGKWDAMMSGHATYEWDAAPGDLILREAGGISTDLTGQPLKFNQPDVRQTPGVLGSSSINLQKSILGHPR